MGKKEQFKKSDKELAKMWDKGREVKESLGEFFTPDDGRYPMIATSAEITTSKNGRKQIAWRMTFLAGDYKGKEIMTFDGLETEQNMAYAMKHIEALGFDAPESFEELEGVLKKIAKKKPKVLIHAKMKGEFTNYYVDKVLSEDEIEELEGVADEDAEDDDDKDDDKDDKEVDDDEEEDADDDDDEEDEDEKEKSSVKKESDDDDEEDEDEKEEDDDEDDDDDDEDEDEDEEELELEVGLKITVLDKKGKKVGVGKIKKINEDDEEVIVKVNGEKMTVPFTQLAPVK